MNGQEISAAAEPILLAEERTRLAKDRTFAAIIRTVLALIAFGITVARVLPDIHPGWILDVLGALLILSGGLIAVLGFRSTHATMTKLRAHGIDEPHWLVVTTRLLLAASSDQLMRAPAVASPSLLHLAISRSRSRRRLG